MNFENVFGASSFGVSAFDDDDESLECFAYPGALEDRWVQGLSLKIEPKERTPWVGHLSLEGPMATNECLWLSAELDFLGYPAVT